ncbi:MAG: hypothetical protein JWO68_3267 [Actinomycetia bacterium]|nr:hypothetical protein [Actinomycetes bacterium]
MLLVNSTGPAGVSLGMRGLRTMVLLVAGLAAACGSEGSLHALHQPPGVVRVTDGRTVSVLDTVARRVVSQVPGGVAAGDWVFRATSAEAGTSLEAIGADGQTSWEHQLDQDLRLRAASADGSLVALLPAEDAVVDPYHPAGRTQTRVVVASTTGRADRTYDLKGNFEPEAFTRKGDALFLVEYLPALHPDRYRVRKLDLFSATVGGVPSIDGHLQDSMRGTARVHAASPDGNRLYTLYTTEGADGPEAFVHVLDLVEGWAHCVDLPAPLGTAPEDDLAIAVGSGDHGVVVVDPAEGVAVEIDPSTLHVTRTSHFRPIAEAGPVQAAVGRTGHVYVARGRTVVVLGDDLRPQSRWTTTSPSIGLVADPDRDRLWQVTDGMVLALDPDDGRRITSVVLPAVGPLPADPGSGPIQCAC